MSIWAWFVKDNTCLQCFGCIGKSRGSGLVRRSPPAVAAPNTGSHYVGQLGGGGCAGHRAAARVLKNIGTHWGLTNITLGCRRSITAVIIWNSYSQMSFCKVRVVESLTAKMEWRADKWMIENFSKVGMLVSRDVSRQGGGHHHKASALSPEIAKSGEGGESSGWVGGNRAGRASGNDTLEGGNDGTDSTSENKQTNSRRPRLRRFLCLTLARWVKINLWPFPFSAHPRNFSNFPTSQRETSKFCLYLWLPLLS